MSWKSISLNELCYKITDGTHHTPTYVSEGIPFLRVTDIQTDRIVWNKTKYIPKNEHINLIKRCHPEKGDILLSKNGTVGIAKVIYWDNEFSIFVSLALLKINHKLVFNTYLCYFLNSPFALIQIQKRAKTGTITNLHLNEIRHLKIPLPPLAQQKRIANILDHADTLRKTQKQKIQQFDQLLKSTFFEMFLGKKRQQWETYPFKEITTSLNHKRIPVKQTDRRKMQGKYPYYGASGIIDYVDKYLFDDEYLLIGEDGANLLSRNTPIAFIAKGQYWVNNHAHISAYNGKANLRYLEFYINAISLEPYVTGSAQPKLNRANLNGIKIPIPPLALQEKFAEIVSKIEAQKAVSQQSLKKYEDLFQCLLQKAFKGEL